MRNCSNGLRVAGETGAIEVLRSAWRYMVEVHWRMSRNWLQIRTLRCIPAVVSQ